MAWTLDYHQPSEDILLDNYFLPGGGEGAVHCQQF